MNYFAHAFAFLRQRPHPYFLAGLAVPDWLQVAARRTKCRTRQVVPWLEDREESHAQLAQGIARHHADDLWFHQTRAFTEISLRFSYQIQLHNSSDEGLRAGFLGHILVELLLDAELIDRHPDHLLRYYNLLGEVDPALVSEQVERMCDRPVGSLAEFILTFLEIRFLEDYAQNDRLCYRLNQVLARVNLPPLPQTFAELLDEFRQEIHHHADRLLLRPAEDDSNAGAA